MVSFQFLFRHKIVPRLLTLAATVAIVMPMGNPLPAIPDSMFARIKASHPRLIINPGTIASIQSEAKSNKDISGTLQFIYKQADSLLFIPACSYKSIDGSILETSRAVLHRILILAFIANVDGNRKYADRALMELDSAARFPNWGEIHFLDVAEMAAAFAIGYDWLFSFMSTDQKAALQRTIKEKAFTHGLLAFEQRRWWVDSRSNWNPVCNGGLALAALAIGNDEPIAKSVLHRSLLSLQQSGALEAFSPDGAYAEGIGYWGYSSQYLAMLFASLQTALNDEFDLSKLPGLAETGLFPIYCEGPTGRMLNYGDASDARIYPFWMSGFGLHYRQPLYGWFAQKHSGLHPLDLLWYDPTATKYGPEALPLGKRFHGPDLAIFRSAWKDSNAAFLSLKAGNPKSEHSHLDVGSFVYEAVGKRWAVDLGPDSYALPNYFIDYLDSATRFTYYRVRAEGHNTLTINPGMSADQEKFPASTLLRFDADKKIAVGDLTTAYTSQASRVLRGISLREGGAALIQDEFILKAPGDIWWRMHTEATITLSKDGHSAILSMDGKRISVSLLLPKTGAVLSILKAEPLVGTPHPAGQNPNQGISVLCVHLSQTLQGTIALWITPLENGTDFPKTLPMVESLDSPFWNPSQAIRLRPAKWGSSWKNVAGSTSMLMQTNPSNLRFTILETGKFNLRILSLQGELIGKMQGMAPGEFTLESRSKPNSPWLIDFQMSNRRIQTLLPKP